MDEPAADMDLGGAAAETGEGASPDVFSDVPADGGLAEGEPTLPQAEPAPPGGGLGGDGGTLEDLGEEEELPSDEQPINGGEGGLPQEQHDPLAVEEPSLAEEQSPPEPEPEPEPDPEPAPEPQPEPEPEAEKPKAAKAAKAKKGGGKKGTTERTYVVLQKSTVEVVGGSEERWVEAMPEGVVAANGEAALRKAYAQLVPEDNGDPVTLCVIPDHYWKPKTVQAKVRHERAVEIS
jgi:hypothetical protein